MINNYAKKLPTVVLYVPDNNMDNAQALVDDDGQPKVFKNFAKASKHVANFIDPKMHLWIKYVNETPVEGAGDREETNNRRCLKCNGFLRPSHTVRSIGTDDTNLTAERLVCPACDLGEA